MILLTVIILLTTLSVENQAWAQILNRTIVYSPHYGMIIGNRIPSAGDRSHFYAYRGIPYAKPPVGALRFKPPVPYNGNPLGVVNATQDKDICVQPDPASFSIVGSEDCLFVNVYVPEVLFKIDLPVLVFIHGGGFIFGSGAYAKDGPDFLMDKNIIYVSFNYRLGPFGFLSTEDAVVPGNNGLKDQILALKWIQKNIVYFGGNPKKVTLMGQSAGAASTSYLVQSPQAKGLFKRAIMLSGNTLCAWSLARNARQTAFELGAALGIQTNSTQTLISQMRSSAAVDISLISYLLSISKPNPLNLLFAPVMEPEHSGSVFSDRSYRMLSADDLNPDKILIGVTNAEGNPFLYIPIPSYYTTEHFTVPNSLHIENDTVSAVVSGEVYNHYFPNDTVTMANAAKLITDTYFIRPTAKYIELTCARKIIYAYEFIYVGPLGNQQQPRTLDGVGHAEDIEYIYKHSYEPSSISSTDSLTRQRWIQLITNFVITGEPTPTSETLLQNLQWGSTSNPDNITYFEFGLNLVMKSNFRAQTRQFWDDIFEEYMVPPPDTY